MVLSVVIVNYNVKYFLEQCLHAVYKAMQGLDVEVYVVDNNSVDGSCNHIREKFPWVKLIENRENFGFSKANNQAIYQSVGEFVLLLNPDTVIEEDTFQKCINFMKEHPEAGALGVKMIDGNGNFLPESKRALPTPWVAFYKIFGLSSLFPKSSKFGRYHLGFLSNDEVHEIEVLAGAFMFIRRSVLDKIGLLDEDYFMYGEDIDLSYRIKCGGYKNYYLPDPKIIHYKGESTKKGSLNYVIVFYKAMIIFAKKHFNKRNARLYSLIIRFAIYLRAAMALSRRFFKKTYRQLVDSLLIFAGFFFGLPVWESFKFKVTDYYPDEFMYYIVPAYIIVWITSIYYSGGYDKPLKIWRFIRGILFGTVSILVIYALLPEQMRYSRAAILMGTFWTLLATLGWRWIMHAFQVNDYQLDLNKKKRIAIVGETSEAERVAAILSKTQIKPEVIGYVNPESKVDAPYIGSVDQISEISRIHKLDEILFCAANVSSQRIIDIMTRLTGSPVNFKIAPPESLSIIGSNSINTSGDLYTIHFNSIGKRRNLRNKRLFDLSASCFLLPLFPVWAWFVKKPLTALWKLLLVIPGFNTIVGYQTDDAVGTMALPKLRTGILNPVPGEFDENYSPDEITMININYAKDYKVSNDIQILLKKFKYLGTR